MRRGQNPYQSGKYRFQRADPRRWLTSKEYGVPIRVGVNKRFFGKALVEKYGGVTAEGLVESALDKVALIEQMGYDNLVISINLRILLQ